MRRPSNAIILSLCVVAILFAQVMFRNVEPLPLFLDTTSLVYGQSQDDDSVLEFFWRSASGVVNHYNIYVAIADVPGDIDPTDINNYTIIGTYLVTDQYTSPPSEAPYPLPLVGIHGKIYYVIVNAEGISGTDLLTLTLDFEDGLDSRSVTPELLQEFVNSGVPLSAGATIQFTLRDRYLFNSQDGVTYKTDLDNGIIPDGLRQLFDVKGYTLVANATVTVIDPGKRWVITSGTTIYDLRLTPSNWLGIYGGPKIKYWVITDVTNQTTYPVRKGDDNILYVTNGAEGPNSEHSDYVWCLLQQEFVPGQPKQTKGLGE